eukprot:gene6578-7268_t
MGNKQSSPSALPSYDHVANSFSSNDLEAVRERFYELSEKAESLDIGSFAKALMHNGPYIQKHILPRIFACCDMNKDGMLDVEEYVCAVALFRFGSLDEKCRFLLAMYDSAKGGSSGGAIVRESLRQLLVDATVLANKRVVALSSQEDWIASLKPLSEAMVETVLFQYATGAANKLDFGEFVNFLKVESTVQGLLGTIPVILNDRHATQ